MIYKPHFLIKIVVKKIKEISEEEFIRRILNNERDLTGIHIKARSPLYKKENYNAFRDYLSGHQEDFRENPIRLSGSIIEGISGSNLCLPYLEARESTLRYCSIDNSSFQNSNFERSAFFSCSYYKCNFRGSNFERAHAFFPFYLLECDCEGSNFYKFESYRGCFSKSKFIRSNLTDSSFRNCDMQLIDFLEAIVFNTNLVEADLENIQNLKTSKGLETVNFYEVKAVGNTKKLIERIEKEREKKERKKSEERARRESEERKTLWNKTRF